MPPVRHHNWTIIIAAWSCVAVVLVVQLWTTIPDGFAPSSIAFVLSQQVLRAAYWALLTPWILRKRTDWGFSGPRRFAHLAMHLSLSFAAMIAFYLIRMPIAAAIEGESIFAMSIWELIYTFNSRNLIDMAFYWIVLVAGWMIAQQQERRALELREEQLRTVVAQAELAALRQQLQPHFLFNALNSVSALMRDDEKSRAVDALAQLSNFMRTLMTNASQPEIELARELDYVQRYLGIEKIRFEERLLDQLDVTEECLNARVPTLILQPIVENAIKHGIARRRSPGRLVISARRIGDRLRLKVTNDPAESLPGQTPPAGQGLGLSTTRARLQKCYGDTFTLDWKLNGLDGTVVALELPFIDASNGTKG